MQLLYASGLLLLENNNQIRSEFGTYHDSWAAEFRPDVTTRKQKKKKSHKTPTKTKNHKFINSLWNVVQEDPVITLANKHLLSQVNRIKGGVQFSIHHQQMYNRLIPKLLYAEMP